ncbi:MAG: hypothetical protein ACI9BW_002466 [Gammaproteobacteria bacterium]|jgi:hypothetical protein
MADAGSSNQLLETYLLNSFWTRTLLLGLIVSLIACSSEPEKPTTTHEPEPQSPPPEPPPQTQSRETAEQSSGSMDSRTSSSQQSGQSSSTEPNEPPSSAATAYVEIRDIPVDENGDPIIEPVPETTASQNNESAQSSSNRTPNPNSEPQSGDSGGSSGPSDRLGGDVEGPMVNIGSETNEERAAKLEQNLDSKLAEFDELMRRTREDAERERAALRGGSAGGRNVENPERGATKSGRGAGGQSDSSSGIGHNPDLVGINRDGKAPQPTGPIPNDIPHARDDDIVARQLREAATRESDPALRERLWEEYRKYSKGVNR